MSSTLKSTKSANVSAPDGDAYSMQQSSNISPNLKKKYLGVFDITRGFFNNSNELNAGANFKALALEHALEFDKKRGVMPNVSVSNVEDENRIANMNGHSEKQLMEQSTPLHVKPADENIRDSMSSPSMKKYMDRNANVEELILNSEANKNSLEEMKVVNRNLENEIQRLNELIISKNLDSNLVEGIMAELKEFKISQQNEHYSQDNVAKLIDEVNSNFSELNKNLKDKDSEILLMSNKINEMNKVNMEEKLHLTEKLQESNLKLDRSLLQVVALNKTIEELGNENEHFNKLNTKLDKLDEELRDKNNQIENLKNFIQEEERRYNEEKNLASNEANALNEKCVTLQNNLQHEQNIHEEKCRGFLETLSIKSQALHSLQISLDKSNDIIEAKNELIKDLKEKTKVQQEKFEEKELSFDLKKQEVDKLAEENEVLKKNNSIMEQNMNRQFDFYKQLELFGIPLGSIMEKAYKQDSDTKSLDKFVKSCNNKNTNNNNNNNINNHNDNTNSIVGFKLIQEKSLLESLKKINTTIKTENTELVQKLETSQKDFNEIEQKLYEANIKVEQLQKESNEKDSNLKLYVSQIEELHTKIHNYNDETSKLLQANMILSTQNSDLKSLAVTENEEKLVKLIDRVDEYAKVIEELKDKLSKSASTISKYEHDVDDFTKTNQELKIIQDKQTTTIKSLTSTLNKLEGNKAYKMTFETAQKSRPGLDRQTYDALMMHKVDTIDMTQLQNIVKNMMLLLEISFSKLTKKLPLLAIFLKYERPILAHFANRIHYKIYGEEIDMKHFTNKIYTDYIEFHDLNSLEHPLEPCLDSLYKRLSIKL